MATLALRLKILLRQREIRGKEIWLSSGGFPATLRSRFSLVVLCGVLLILLGFFLCPPTQDPILVPQRKVNVPHFLGESAKRVPTETSCRGILGSKKGF